MQSRHESINGQTRLVGVLGRGISHTLSPLIHNQAMRDLGLNGVYVPFDCQTNFPKTDFFQAMWDAGAWGFNVTVPYKEAAASLLGQGQWSSINTIYRGKQGWEVCSTDGLGFLRGLSEIGKSLDDFEAVVILGNGGSARALSRTFHEVHPSIPITILRRSQERDRDWHEQTRGPLALEAFQPDRLLAHLRRFPSSLVVQTTSAPLYGETLAEFSDILPSFPGALVDIVYGRVSSLFSRAQELGLQCQDGVPMLIGQALLSQEKWWGRSASFEHIEPILRQALRH